MPPASVKLVGFDACIKDGLARFAAKKKKIEEVVRKRAELFLNYLMGYK